VKKFTDVPEPPVPAYQNVGEFGALWEYVAARPHARVLEIGSLFGGTLWYWAHLPAIETLVSVDLPSDWPQVRDGVRDARTHWREWLAPRVAFLDCQANSHDPRVVPAVVAGATIDFLFIDGDHSYDGVRADWLLWSPVVRPGGIVAFHDTWPNFDRHEPGVVRWVDELRHHLPSIEWTDPDGVGICAFQTPGAP
jgi:predicted O-methyltransferase YrrM